MADAPKTVRGTLTDGTTVQVSEETAELLGADFTAEGGSKTATKKAAASKKSDN